MSKGNGQIVTIGGTVFTGCDVEDAIRKYSRPRRTRRKPKGITGGPLSKRQLKEAERLRFG